MYRILFIILFFPTLVFSHELKPSIVDFKFKKKNEFLNFNLKIRFNLEAILANIDPSHDDTDESKNKDYYDYLRSLDSKKLKIVFNKTLKDFQNNMLILQSGKKINFQIDKVDIGNIGDLNISRETIIFISGKNIGKDNLRLGWASDYGPIILRVANLDGEIVYTEYIKNSLISKSFSIEKKYSNLFNEITKYLIIGFQHIFPKGIDHILFVLGLFLFSPKFKPLFIQISVFTIAIVKTEICINSGLNFGEKRNRPNTNKIWSIPLGKMCWKPIIKYLVISLNKFEYFFSIENDLEIKEFLMYSV